MSDTVAFFVPATRIVAPIIGSPLLSVTVPFTVPTCCTTCVSVAAKAGSVTPISPNVAMAHATAHGEFCECLFLFMIIKLVIRCVILVLFIF